MDPVHIDLSISDKGKGEVECPVLFNVGADNPVLGIVFLKTHSILVGIKSQS